MKKVFYIALTAIAFAALLAGCAGGPKQQSDSPVSSTASAPPPAPKRTVNYTIIDWQGGALGRGVPEWVDYASDRNKDALSKIPGLNGKEMYIYNERGADLDLIRANTQVNAFAQISSQIKSGIVAKAGNLLSGDKDSEESKKQAVDSIAGMASQNVLSGFTLDRDFWQKIKYNDNGREAIDYYAVFTIGTEDFKHQLDLALGKIEAKNQADREAKEAIRSAIMDAESLLE